MCGIYGHVASDQLSSEQKIEIRRILKNRGPDNQAWQDYKNTRYISLFHSRLSILGLGEDGNQPYRTPCNRYDFVYNGEVYNYVELRTKLVAEGCNFKTTGDTEVLAHLISIHGLDAFNHLDGMFAIGLYDKLAQKLYLIRDQYGIKPLFYKFNNMSFSFSSDVRALVEKHNKNKGDLNTILRYLEFGGYDDQDASFFDGILRVSPGSYIEFDIVKNKVENKKWYNLLFENKLSIEGADPVSLVRDLVFKTVERQLRSDVPLAFALSGGLDSSALVCVARNLMPDAKITTFTYAPNVAKSELKWAEIVSHSVQAKSIVVRPDQSELEDACDHIIYAQGEPFGSTSTLAQHFVYRAMKEDGFKVAIDGQGGDEIFCGYNAYPRAHLGRHIRSGNIRNLYSCYRSLSTVNSYGKLNSELVKAIINQWTRSSSKRTHTFLKGYETSFKYSEEIEGVNYFANELVRAQHGQGLQSLLRHADRNSMDASIESRVPFLTRDLSQLVLNLDSKFFEPKNSHTKPLLHQAMKGIVPAEILFRTDKVGFEADEKWLSNNAHIQSRILENDSIKLLLPPKDLKSFISHATTRQIWRLLNFAIWSERFNVQIT